MECILTILILRVVNGAIVSSTFTAKQYPHRLKSIKFLKLGEATLGALADSFYEYLLKLWIYGNKKDDKLLDTYLNAMEAAKNKLIGKSQAGLTFAGEYQGGRLAYKMGHLACFSAGRYQ